MWYGMAEWNSTKTRSRRRGAALPAALGADCASNSLRAAGARRAATSHSRIGWPAWTEPDHRIGRLRDPRIRGADFGAGGSRQLRDRRRRIGRRGGLERTAGAERHIRGRAQRRMEQGRDQLRGFAALARPVPAGRVSRDLRHGAGPPGSGGHFAARFAERIRTAAALPDGRGATAAGGGSGRRPADYQRLPAGAGPDWAGAAAAGRHGGGGRSALHRLEESAHRNGRATLRNSGGRRRHGCRATGAGAGTREAAVPGGDLEFSESDRRDPAAGRQEGAAGCGAQGERAGDRKRHLWRAALQRRAAARAEATGRERRNGAAAQLLEGQLSRDCGWAGRWGRSR